MLASFSDMMSLLQITERLSILSHQRLSLELMYVLECGEPTEKC